MNLATLPGPSATIGRNAATGAPAKSSSHLALWLGGVVVALAVGGLLLLAYAKRRNGADDQSVRARDVFKMPGDVDGFAVVALLRRLRTSPIVQLGEPQQQELQQDLQRIQQTCFGAQGSAMSEADLRSVAEKWLRVAC